MITSTKEIRKTLAELGCEKFNKSNHEIWRHKPSGYTFSLSRGSSHPSRMIRLLNVGIKHLQQFVQTNALEYKANGYDKTTIISRALGAQFIR